MVTCMMNGKCMQMVHLNYTCQMLYCQRNYSLSKLILHEGDVILVGPNRWNGQQFLFKVIGLSEGTNMDLHVFRYQQGSVDKGWTNAPRTSYPVDTVDEWYTDGDISFVKRAIQPAHFNEELFTL
jgi:hypothetical protein